MAFVNREDEIALTRGHLTRPGSTLLVVYGRRRIGKTALILEALRGVPRAAYHVATRSTLVDELARLSATVARAWEMPLLAAQPLASLDAFFALLETAAPGSALVLDELPYLVETEPSFPGRLQASWDRVLSRRGLKLIVCGSSISMMEQTFLSERSPLFGRRTGQLRLGPLGPHHLGRMFRGNAVESLELAALVGGVPGYVERLDPSLDLRSNLRRFILARGEPLYEEVPFLLREELREPRVYHAILAAIAQGATKFGEIASKVGLDRANLSRYLAILADLGLVAREVPITEHDPVKSKKGLYRITDPFVRTWFALVHPHRDRLERGLVAEVMSEHIAPMLSRYLSRSIEPILVDLLMGSPLRALVPFTPARAGRYWSAEMELDMVLLDASSRRAFIAEVKWGDRPVGLNLLDDLQARAARVAELSGLEKTFAIISRAGFHKGRKLAAHERAVDARKIKLA